MKWQEAWSNLDLRVKQVVVFGGATLIMVLGISFAAGTLAARQLRADSGDYLQGVASQMAGRLSKDMFERLIDLQMLAEAADWSPVIGNAKPARDRARALLVKLQRINPTYTWIGFAGPDGIVRVSTGRVLEGEDVSSRPWFTGGREGPYFGDVHEAKLLSERLVRTGAEPLRFIDVAVPVYDDQANFLGVLAVHIDWSWAGGVRRALLRDRVADEQWEVYVLNAAGDVLLGSTDDLPQTPLPAQSSAGHLLTRWSDGQEYVVGFAADRGYEAFNGLGWRVLVRQPTAVAYASVTEIRREIILIGIIAILLAAVGGWWIAGYFVAPLRRLTEAAARITAGERAVVVPQQAGRDIPAVLSRTIAEMVAALQEREQRLQETNAALEARVAARTAELGAAKQVAEDANRAKSTFLSSMSHELRTPLNAIVGLTQIMQDESDVAPEQRENLAIIAQSGEHLLTLINEVLDISKIEAGKMELHETEFDLPKTVRALQAMLQQKADAKGLALLVEVDPAVPQRVYGDQGKLRQVLINLLNNAVKFTARGSVSLRVEPAGGNSVAFVVADTGAGIAPEELDRLFVEFEQTASGRGSQEGTGLGLPISRKFAGLMGGTLTVASEVGAGTAFTVLLPLPPVHAGGEATNAVGAGAAMAASGSAAGIPGQSIGQFIGQSVGQIAGLAPGSPTFRVLIVDDQQTNRQVLRKTLQPLALDLCEATGGEEALVIWETWRPHLIWLDMRMRGIDGEEVARTIRRREAELAAEPAAGGPQAVAAGDGTALRTCILAITASVFSEQQPAILAAGCDDIVPKPFQRRMIFDKMAQHLGMRYSYRPAPMLAAPAPETADPSSPSRSAPDGEAGAGQDIAAGTPAPPASAARVLVVDDNTVNQKFALRLLQKLGAAAAVAPNGAEAIAALHTAPYDVILMDMQMPVMGGVEAARRIHQEWGDRAPVIVALTGSSDADDYLAARAAGMHEWLVKPLRLDDLRALLARYPSPA